MTSPNCSTTISQRGYWLYIKAWQIFYWPYPFTLRITTTGSSRKLDMEYYNIIMIYTVARQEYIYVLIPIQCWVHVDHIRFRFRAEVCAIDKGSLETPSDYIRFMFLFLDLNSVFECRWFIPIDIPNVLWNRIELFVDICLLLLSSLAMFTDLMPNLINARFNIKFKLK